MIRSGQIPNQVVKTLQKCLNGCDCDECLSVCIAAAINAWPLVDVRGVYYPWIILPLPMENTNEKV